MIHYFISIFFILMSLFLNAQTREEFMAKAQRFSREGHLEESQKIYRQLNLDNPKDIEIKLALARVLAWKQQYADSESIYLEILSEAPENPEACLGLAQVKFWNSQLKDSLKILNTLIEKHPANNEIVVLRNQVRQALNDQNIFFIKFSGIYEHFSFFDQDSWGGKSFFSYTSPKMWAMRASFLSLSKFNSMSYQASLGATYWITNNTVLSFDAETSPGSAVLPIQAYTIDISHTLWKFLTPSISYQFSGYQSSSVHIFSPGLSFQISKKLELKGKYYFTLSQFIQQSNQDYENMAKNSSGYVNLVMTPLSWFQTNVGCSLGSEAFDSGNPVTGLNSFSYQDIFWGAQFQIKQQFGIDFTVDQQFRDNGFSMTSLEFGLSYLW